MNQHAHSSLIRGIRRWDLVAMVINGVIGAGIFGLPSKVFSLVGTYSLVAFLVCAAIVTLIILCFAEVGSRFEKTGGPYLYASEALGPVVGFEVGWLVWLTRVAAFAANCNLLVSYLGFFLPAAAAGPWRAAVIAGIVVSLTVVNIVGVRNAALFGNIFTIGKLIPIVLFIAAGLFFIDPLKFSFAGRPSYSAFTTSVLLLVYAFTGFEMAGIPAGEIRDPQRTLPAAYLTAIGMVVVCYILIQVVCIGTLPELAGSERPLADAGNRFLGSSAASIISAGAVVSIVGNLNLVLLAGSRLPFAMAERKELPRIFSVTHRRFKTPYFAILFTAAIMLVLTISGTFIYAVTISTIARLVSYGATCVALPLLRGRRGSAMFKAPAGTAVSVSALALIAWLLSNITLREARDSGIAAALGLVVYIAYRFRRTPRVPPAGENL